MNLSGWSTRLASHLISSRLISHLNFSPVLQALDTRVILPFHFTLCCLCLFFFFFFFRLLSSSLFDFFSFYHLYFHPEHFLASRKRRSASTLRMSNECAFPKSLVLDAEQCFLSSFDAARPAFLFPRASDLIPLCRAISPAIKNREISISDQKRSRLHCCRPGLDRRIRLSPFSPGRPPFFSWKE